MAALARTLTCFGGLELCTLLSQALGEEADVTVILATNNFRSVQEVLATRYLESGLVSALVNSALVGVRKPDPSIYRQALDELGAEGAQCFFIDDRPENIEAARDAGYSDCTPGRFLLPGRRVRE